MDQHMTYVFAGNIFLIFIDATVGYYAAPAVALLAGTDEDGLGRTVRSVRRLLSWVVTLYMFFNCLAFFDDKEWLLYFTTAVLAVDIAAQLLLFRKVIGRRGR